MIRYYRCLIIDRYDHSQGSTFNISEGKYFNIGKDKGWFVSDPEEAKCV